MKTLLFLSIFVLVIISAILISNTPYASAILVGRSKEQLHNENDIILLGKVVSLKEIPDQDVTQYIISPEEYLKPQNNESVHDLITVQGYGTTTRESIDFRVYNVGDRALFYLVKQADHYFISPYSFVTESTCNVTQLFNLDYGGGDFTITQDNNTVDHMYVDKPINVTAFVHNHFDLKSRDVELEIKVHTPKPSTILSEKRQVHLEECKGYVSSGWSFVPKVEGRYAVSVTAHDANGQGFGGGAFDGIDVINPNGTSTTTFGSTGIASINGSKIIITYGSSNVGCGASNTCYEPANLAAKKGTGITWYNNDTASHTVTDGKPSDDQTGQIFDSGLILPGKTFEFVFDEAGTYDYYCQVHPWMTGIVNIANNSQTLNVTSTGSGLQEPQNKSYLQEQLNIGKRPITFNQKQNEDTQNIFYVVITGIPIFVIITTLMFWFIRK